VKTSAETLSELNPATFDVIAVQTCICNTASVLQRSAAAVIVLQATLAGAHPYNKHNVEILIT
jgi:hypothetical protein